MPSPYSFMQFGCGGEAARRNQDRRIGSRFVHARINEPTLADVFPIPQHCNAPRFKTRLDPYLKPHAAVARRKELPAFAEPKFEPGA